MIRFALISGLLAALTILSAGQDQATQGADTSRSTPAPAMSGVLGIESPVPEENTSADLPQIPSLLGGPRMSLAIGSEQERSNYLRAGLNVGAAYDDNALMTPNDTIGNASYSVFPNISIEQSRSRLRWKLGYAAGLTANQRLSNRNQGSHDLNFESQFRLSPHVNLRIKEDFTLTSGFFAGNGGFGVGNGGPNTTVITPLSNQRSSSTVAEINYHLALNDLIGASGSFSDLHFSNVPQGFALTDTRTAAASAYWLHGFGRDWAGISYSFQRVTFEPNGETLVHSIMALNTVKLPGRLTVAGFVGPEYSENQGLLPGAGNSLPSSFHEWSVTGGGEMGWQKEHTSVNAGYSRRLNGGGGVLGVVRLQSVHGELRQQLRPGWAVLLGANYGNNHTLTVVNPGSPTSINTASVGGSIERNLGRSLGLRLGYSHDFQDQIGGTVSNLSGRADRNRVFVTLGYQWARALGR